MPGLQIMITDAGIEAIADAQGGATEAVVIAQIGLTNAPFVMAPTLEVLPGEFRRIATVAGQAVAENILHVTAYDSAAIAYDVTGFGLYDADDNLIAIYSEAADPILSKAALATSLFAIDISIAADQAAVIEFGDPIFLNPPATETVAGVAKISTDALADAGVDDTTIMSPKKVKRVLDAALAAINAAVAAFMGAANAAIAAISARTISGGGLATGGGDLTANRVINVTKSSQAEVQALVNNSHAVTPEDLLGLFTMPAGGATDEWRIGRFHFRKTQVAMSANSTGTASFGTSFPNACLFAWATGGMTGLSQDSNNGFVPAGGWTASGATVNHPGNAGATFSVLAIGY